MLDRAYRLSSSINCSTSLMFICLNRGAHARWIGAPVNLATFEPLGADSGASCSPGRFRPEMASKAVSFTDSRRATFLSSSMFSARRLR